MGERPTGLSLIDSETPAVKNKGGGSTLLNVAEDVKSDSVRIIVINFQRDTIVNKIGSTETHQTKCDILLYDHNDAEWIEF